MIPEPILTTVLRTFQGITYLRVQDPSEALAKLHAFIAKFPSVKEVAAYRWKRTQPKHEYTVKPEDSLQENLKWMLETDPLDRLFYTAGVANASTVKELLPLLVTFNDKRSEKDTYVAYVILLGSDPATEVIPEEFRHAVLPLDLVQTEPPDRHVAVTRKDALDPTTARSWLEKVLDHYVPHLRRRTEAETAWLQAQLENSGILVGLTVSEAEAAISQSTIAHKPSMGYSRTPLDPVILEAYRTRWNRVA
jgi:hypothetical protein